MLTRKRFDELFYRDLDKIRIYRRLSRGRGKAGEEAGGIRGGGYWYISIDCKRYKRADLNYWLDIGEWPRISKGVGLDHNDRNKLNDHVSNLYPPEGNNKNLPMLRTNTSGVTGVNWHKASKKWRVEVGHKSFGYFKIFSEAVEARKKAEIKYGYSKIHGKRDTRP